MNLSNSFTFDLISDTDIDFLKKISGDSQVV